MFKNKLYKYLVCSFICIFSELPSQEDNKLVLEKVTQIRKDLLDSKFAKDSFIISTLDYLNNKYSGVNQADKTRILDVFKDVFRLGKKRPVEHAAIYFFTVQCLGSIEEDKSADILYNLLLPTSYFSSPKWRDFQIEVYSNIGLTKRIKYLDFFVKTSIRNPIDRIKKVAIEALLNYKDLDLKKRKYIFEELLKDYERVEGGSKANLDPNDPVVALNLRTLLLLRYSWNGTLGAMSGQYLGTSTEYRKWWNKNKDNAINWSNL